MCTDTGPDTSTSGSTREVQDIKLSVNSAKLVNTFIVTVYQTQVLRENQKQNVKNPTERSV